MSKFLLVSLFLLFSILEQQSHEGILIKVEKAHKKITYTAENITDKDIDLFFRVESTGFRRSADRPAITTIPAKKKIDLLTMIPLTGKDTTHTYMAIITQKENNLSFTKTDSLENDIRRAKPGQKQKK